MRIESRSVPAGWDGKEGATTCNTYLLIRYTADVWLRPLPGRLQADLQREEQNTPPQICPRDVRIKGHGDRWLWRMIEACASQLLASLRDFEDRLRCFGRDYSMPIARIAPLALCFLFLQVVSKAGVPCSQCPATNSRALPSSCSTVPLNFVPSNTC